MNHATGQYDHEKWNARLTIRFYKYMQEFPTSVGIGLRAYGPSGRPWAPL